MIFALILAFAEPVSIESKTDLLAFTYSWSAEAAAVPSLDRRFRLDARNQKRKALAMASEDRAARRAMPGAEFHAHYFSRTWTTTGQSARLLSLQAATETFTGGAHGNRGTTALLWDRKLGREIALTSLTVSPIGWTGAIRQAFCTLLDRERQKRRQELVKRTDMFGNCPELKDVTVLIEDTKGNGRFDHVRVTADPYVAGPYAEGEYVISLPVTATMISRLKPEFRASFEPQPPVQ